MDTQGGGAPIAPSVEQMMASIMPGVIAQLVARFGAPPIEFVNGGQYQTVTELLASLPAAKEHRGKFARVSDLWGTVQTTMVCEGDVSGYYWRPQRTDYAPPPIVMTGGNMALVPLVTAPIINLTGALSSAITITPSLTNVWPGATFTVTSNSILNLFGITIGGLIGGGTVPLLSGGIRTLTYFSGSGWRAS